MSSLLRTYEQTNTRGDKARDSKEVSIFLTHAHTLTFCYCSGQIKLNLTPKDVFKHTVAPPLLHATQRHKQKHAFPTPSPFSRTRTRMHPQTNKRITRFAADVKQGQQPLPPPTTAPTTDSLKSCWDSICRHQYLHPPFLPNLPFCSDIPLPPPFVSAPHTQNIWPFISQFVLYTDCLLSKTFLLAIAPLHTFTEYTLLESWYMTCPIVIP